MRPSPLEEALSVAADRLDALGAGGPEQIQASMETMALAFVGLDVDIRELTGIAEAATDPYGESIIDASANTWHRLSESEDDPSEVFAIGADYGRTVARNLLGVFCIGVLLGELHRSRMAEREATSDD